MKWIAVLILSLLCFLPAHAQPACEEFRGVDTGTVMLLCKPTPTATPSPPPSPTNTNIPTQTPTATRTPTQTPTPTVQPTVQPTGLWISRNELMALPTSGDAWTQLQTAANSAACVPNLGNQDDTCNVTTLARALAYVRTGDTRYRDQVVATLRTVSTWQPASTDRTLALGRELAAYVISADLINLRQTDPALHAQFSTFLRAIIVKILDGRTLVTCQAQRPNNWGTMCGASLAAAYVYLGDANGLSRTANTFHGYLGDRSIYAGFTYGDLGWQADPLRPVGVNPAGAQLAGHNVDGALPEEMRRAGAFKWPPAVTGYPWEALQGAIVQAEILHRAGYPAWTWQQGAICRSVAFLYQIGWQPLGDDAWQIPLVNRRCGTTYNVTTLGTPGKIAGWTFFTHQGHGGAILEPLQAPTFPQPLGQSRVVVAESLGDLEDEIEYLKQLEGWTTAGDVEAGGGTYRQQMER